MEIRQETDIKVQIRKTLFEIEQQKRARVQRFLLEIGLTPGQGQARILSSLAAVGNVTQRELADACLMDVTTMSRTLDRLEEKGLIRRERDPRSRRRRKRWMPDSQSWNRSCAAAWRTGNSLPLSDPSGRSGKI